MKTLLMHPDTDLDLERDMPWNAEALIQDLELSTLVETMAAGDGYLADVSRRVMLHPLRERDDIEHRQLVLVDCLAHPATVRRIYDIAVEAIEREKHEHFGLFRQSPDAIVGRSVRVLDMFVDILARLRKMADDAGDFDSPGFTRLFAMLSTELGDEYLDEIRAHTKELGKRGVSMSARLGTGNKGSGYVLRTRKERSWTDWVPFTTGPSRSFLLADRDESGFGALRSLRDRGLNLAGNALAQSCEHILSFFRMLRAELAFYLGCLNLHERLTELGARTCFPEVAGVGSPRLAAAGLYEPCLTLRTGAPAVANDLSADGKRLLLITGANQGGKSTFLRSVGVAQLMAQCGMFVPAQRLSLDARSAVCTHFKREEDAGMQRGKLDEELHRMGEIADHIGPDGLLLDNESFAATNEREGSEIARHVIRAMTDSGVKVVFVTHLYDLAHGLYNEPGEEAVFLRAQRGEDGARTFRVEPGEPLPTSYGADSYQEIFGEPGPVRE